MQSAAMQEEDAVIDLSNVKNYYIQCGYTDLRKGLNGLTGIVAGIHGIQPDDESLFLFCGRRADRIKGLFWNGDGFAVITKSLTVGRFRWPRASDELRKLTKEEFEAMLVEREPGEFSSIEKVCPYQLY